MTVHHARVLALAAVLVWMGACGRSERPGAQQTLDEASIENPFRRRLVGRAESGPGGHTPQQTLDELRALAEQGDAEAQVNLGLKYDTGEGVVQDAAEAIRWYRLAADQGNANAQYILGVRFESGRGVPQDDAEAIRWLHLAVDQGDPEAQVFLGIKYELGAGVSQDYAEAIRWYRLAGDRGKAATSEMLAKLSLNALRELADQIIGARHLDVISTGELKSAGPDHAMPDAEARNGAAARAPANEDTVTRPPAFRGPAVVGRPRRHHGARWREANRLTDSDRLSSSKSATVSVLQCGHPAGRCRLYRRNRGAHEHRRTGPASLEERRHPEERPSRGLHRPFHKTVMGRHFVNPGSVGRPRDEDPRTGYAVIEMDGNLEVKFPRFEYDIARTAAALEDKGLPPKLVEKFQTGT